MVSKPLIICQIKSPGQIRYNFKQEDQLIVRLVHELGRKKWTIISKRLEQQLGATDRNGKQIRERFHNHLDPAISKTEWTLEQEEELLRCQKRIGNKWSKIAKFIPGRTDNNIKNHFYSTLRRTVRWVNKQISKHRLAASGIKTIKNQLLSVIIAASVDEQEDLGNYQSMLAKEILQYLYEIGIKKGKKLIDNKEYTQLCNKVLNLIVTFKDLKKSEPAGPPVQRKKLLKTIKAQEPAVQIQTRQQASKALEAPSASPKYQESKPAAEPAALPPKDNTKIEEELQAPAPLVTMAEQKVDMGMYQMSDSISVYSVVNSPLTPCDIHFSFAFGAASFFLPNQQFMPFIPPENETNGNSLGQ